MDSNQSHSLSDNFTAGLLVAFATWFHGQQSQSKEDWHCPLPSLSCVDVRPPISVSPASPCHDELNASDLRSIGGPQSCHAPSRALSVAISPPPCCRRSPEIRGSGPTGLAPASSKDASTPISAAQTATCCRPLLSLPPRSSLQRCRRLAHPPTSGPIALDSASPGAASGIITSDRLALDGDRPTPLQLDSSATSHLSSAARSNDLDAADDAPLVRPVPSGPSSAMAAACSNASAAFDFSADSPLTSQSQLTGQTSSSSQTSCSRVKISSAPSLAASSSAMPLPIGTSQSPSANGQHFQPGQQIGFSQPPTLVGQRLFVGQTPICLPFGPRQDSAFSPFVSLPLPSQTIGGSSTSSSAPDSSLGQGLTWSTIVSSQRNQSPSAPFDSVCSKADSLLMDSVYTAPSPIRKDDIMTISIPDQTLDRRIRLFETALMGRLIMRPGDKPWNYNDLKNKLQSIWNPIGDWHMTSLGKGFYTFKFNSIAERDRIRVNTTPFLRPGTLKLFQWTPRFNPYEYKTSLVQVWVRFHNIAEEYFDPSILWGLARCVGTPLKIDPHSLNGTYAHFARVLVEIDVSKDVESQVKIEHSNGMAVLSSISYERLPEFCQTCYAIGHSNGSCRKLQRSQDAAPHTSAVPPTEKRISNPPKQTWQVVQRKKGSKPLTSTPVMDNVPMAAQSEQPISDSMFSSTSLVTDSVVAGSTSSIMESLPSSATDHVPSSFESSLQDRSGPPEELFPHSPSRFSILEEVPVDTDSTSANPALEVSFADMEAQQDMNSAPPKDMVCIEAQQHTDSAMLQQDDPPFDPHSSGSEMALISTASPLQASSDSLDNRSPSRPHPVPVSIAESFRELEMLSSFDHTPHLSYRQRQKAKKKAMQKIESQIASLEKEVPEGDSLSDKSSPSKCGILAAPIVNSPADSTDSTESSVDILPTSGSMASDMALAQSHFAEYVRCNPMHCIESSEDFSPGVLNQSGSQFLAQEYADFLMDNPYAEYIASMELAEVSTPDRPQVSPNDFYAPASKQSTPYAVTKKKLQNFSKKHKLLQIG